MVDRGARSAWPARWRAARTAALSLVAPPLVSLALRLLTATIRVEIEGLEPVQERWRRGERVILAFWHGRLLAMAIGAWLTDARVCILVSRNRDGEIASRALRRWGVETVRGSTSRGAVAGLRGLVRAHRRGHDLGVAPDGPRGPSGLAQPGVAFLARATGAAVVPIGAAASRAWRLRSWDRLMIPKPFSRLLLIAGEPFSVPADADAEAIEDARLRVAAALDVVNDRAEARWLDREAAR